VRERGRKRGREREKEVERRELEGDENGGRSELKQRVDRNR
jgi:hypothetical protein